MEIAVIIIAVLVVVLGAIGAYLRLGPGARDRRPTLEPPLAPPPKIPPSRREPQPTATDEGDGSGSVAVDEAAPPSPEVDEAPPIEVVAPVRPTFRERLAKARGTVSGYLGSILSRSTIDAETWDDLEEALIRADVGVGPATELLDAVRARVKEQGIEAPQELVEAVKDEMKARLSVADRSLRWDEGRTNVWLFVGVNGVGKTTTIGKIGKREAEVGRSVVMAAGDTFRAAAAEQLGTWAERSGATLVRGAEGADPSSVVFDGITKAAASGADLVLADTAGRLHNKANLMEELRKVRRVADKDPGHVTETLLVLDATTGQNGLAQARVFTEAVDVTGVVLTKLDGSAKGGIVVAIQEELGIPVKLVGLGETADDLVAFDPDEFVDALFATT
jgi:fused signal recognition particle receptor